MRDYGKVAPQFWTGQTGKALKAGGPEAVIVAMYLMTSPHANMIGIYYLPQLYLAHETGLGVDGAAKGLRVCVEAGFCAYDEDAETIFVPRMASYQVAESLSVKDNRRIAVLRELDSVGSSEFADMFRQLYATPFCLEAPRYPSVPHHRFSHSLVRQVVEACGGVCKGCKTPFSGDLKPTIDHVVAKINGGTRDRANLQALCGPCNSRKAVLDRALFWERSGLEAAPYEGVPKGSIESSGPLASQEQEQEQEHSKPPSLRDAPLSCSTKQKSITFQTWLLETKAKGEMAVSDYQPVWDYAKLTGIPEDWIEIAWIRFKERYTGEEKAKKKRYIDWRGVFLRAVKENWLGLWFFSEKTKEFCLTTVGVCADIDTREAS